MQYKSFCSETKAKTTTIIPPMHPDQTEVCDAFIYENGRLVDGIHYCSRIEAYTTYGACRELCPRFSLCDTCAWNDDDCKLQAGQI